MVICAIVVIMGHGALGLWVGSCLVAFRACASLILNPQAGPASSIDLYSVVVLAMAYAWLRFVGRLEREERALDARGLIAVEERRERERHLARIRMDGVLASTGARRALTRILQSPCIDADLHRELRTAEAGLRDHLRCPALEHPGLTPEVAAARGRGVEVTLLGPGPSERGGHDRLTSALADELVLFVREAQAGDRVTIRRLRPNSGPGVLTLLITHPDGSAHRRTFTRDGRLGGNA